MSDEAGEKKHDPGEKKWRDAAEKGQLPRSADIGAVAVLVTGAATLTFGSGPAVQAIGELATLCFGIGDLTLDVGSARVLAGAGMRAVLVALAAPMGAVLLAGLVANLSQTQMQLATKALEPKFDKLDVIAGVKNAYFSSTPFVELVKGLGKMLALGGAVTMTLWPRLQQLPRLAASPPQVLLQEMADLAWQVVLAALPVMLVLAAADYAYSTWKITENLKRTDKEVRDDHKESEGDPMLKAKRRQRAIQIARSVNLALIQQADVVVTNPTHYAVALRYRREEDAAPIVLVKGVDALALKIRQRAREAKVPQVENRALARGLYAEAEMGHPIPESYYKPVAKVLATVMKRRRKPVRT